MPTWLEWIAKYLFTELPNLFKRHLFRFGLAVTLSVLAAEAAFVNPWFGSTEVKARLIGWSVSDHREFQSIVSRLSEKKPGKLTPFEQGAREAGLYLSSDQKIIDEWTLASEKLSWKDAGEVPALTDARERAESFRPPFQLVGRAAIASSPDCIRDRPPFGKVYLNVGRSLGRLFLAQDTIKIMNANGGGTPVIAVVELPDRIMPAGVDLSMNKYQMEKMLGVLSMTANVRVSRTTSPPNQVTDDDKPDMVRKCRLPDVR